MALIQACVSLIARTFGEILSALLDWGVVSLWGRVSGRREVVWGGVGTGISARSADEVRSVAGLTSDEGRRLLPDAAPEVINRDEFVLDDGRNGG